MANNKKEVSTSILEFASVADLDGTIHLLDAASAKILWSFATGSPIYSSYQANIDDLYYVDCGDDWDLYVHSKSEGKLEKLSISADDYIRRTPHISEDGEITLGSKNTTGFLVDAKIGRVVRSFNLDILPPSAAGFPTAEEVTTALHLVEGPDMVEVGVDDLGAFEKNLVYITRTDYLLQHYSPNSRKLLWNVAFAEIEVEFRCWDGEGFVDEISQSANTGTKNKEWRFPCQVKMVALRTRDQNSLPLDKIALYHLKHRDRVQFLPGEDHIPALRGPAYTLPSAAGRSTLELPSSSWSSEIFANPQMWSTITAILSVVGFIIYKYLAGKKKIKVQTRTPKKKKKKKVGPF
ncbi:Serine/threonine-protein kinase/endoribonuclease IRE1b [Linum grandiflorum]